MLKDITVGQYYPADSMLHRADPRMKIILTMLYMVAIFIVNNYWGFLSIFLFTIIAISVSGVPFLYTLKGLKPILFIVIFAVVINIFTVAGRPLYTIWLLTITYEGVETASKMAMRLTLLIVSASLLTFTTTPILLTDGIEKLLKPLQKIGVPAHEIAMMMTIALRFIPTLLEETDKIIKAQTSRGADFDTGNIMEKAKSFIPVLVPLFVSAFRRADDLATAMEARCYRGSEGRTRMKQLKFKGLDFLLLGSVLIFLIFVLVQQYL